MTARDRKEDWRQQQRLSIIIIVFVCFLCICASARACPSKFAATAVNSFP